MVSVFLQQPTGDYIEYRLIMDDKGIRLDLVDDTVEIGVPDKEESLLPFAARVNPNLDGLKVRSSPNLDGDPLTQLLPGTEVFVQPVKPDDYPALDSNYSWWQLVFPFNQEALISKFVAGAKVDEEGNVEVEYLVDFTRLEVIEPDIPEIVQPESLLPIVERRFANGAVGFVFKRTDDPWGINQVAGVNIRYAPYAELDPNKNLDRFYYAPQQIYLNPNTQEWNEMLNGLNNADWDALERPMNAVGIRLYVPYKGLDNAFIAERTLRVLDQLNERNMQAILVWNDSLKESGCYWQGEGPWHSKRSPQDAHHHKDHEYFKQTKVSDFMLPGLRVVMKKIKEHPAILMHEFMNEPHVENEYAAAKGLKACLNQFINTIREFDQVSPIALGAQDSLRYEWAGAAFLESGQFIQEHLNAVGCHMYSQDTVWEGQTRVEQDLFTLAPSLGQPSYLGEVFVDVYQSDPTVAYTNVLFDLLEDYTRRGLWAWFLWGYSYGNRDYRLGKDHFAWIGEGSPNKGYFDQREKFYEFAGPSGLFDRLRTG